MAQRKLVPLSDYEKERLERIKENEKMLEELFPGGTDKIYFGTKGKRPVKRRRELDGNSRGSGSGGSSECASDSDQEHSTGGRRSYTVKKVAVSPRRNPSRKARAEGMEGSRRTTRSMTSSGVEQLEDGLEEEDLEFKKKVYRTVRTRVRGDVEELPVELDDVPAVPPTRHIKVIESCSDKVYDRVSGTTCHQCRQKTTDIKTVCHNKNCRGVRGQFCAVCLLNRYGEGLAESLRNPEWVCPPCRKICNCSFCMPKRGKAPTGILIHLARESGFDSVHEYLDKTDYDY